MIQTYIGFETLIGNVDLKTKRVHFNVQRNTSFRSQGHVTFDVEELNMGGAMNLAKGEFTAPVDGIYHFEFRALSDHEIPRDSTFYLMRVVEKNQVHQPYCVAATHMDMGNRKNNVPGSLTASLRMKASEVVYVSTAGTDGHLFDNFAHYTQFVGWLVEEDLILA